MSQNRVTCPPQLEELEQRQVLSGLAPLLSGASLTAVTPSSDAPQGLLNPGLQVNVGLPGLLDVRAATNVAVGGETQGPALAVGMTAAASLGGGTEGGTGQATPLSNLGLSLNLPGGTTTGPGGTSSGAEGTIGQVTILIPITPYSMASPGINSAGAAAASTSPITVSSPMVPTAVGIPSQTGLSTLTQTSALAIAEEDVQLAINSIGRPEQGKPQEEKDAEDEREAAPASNLLPGRRPSSPSPTSPNTGEESEAPRGSSVIPLLLEPEALETPDGSPWFFQLPQMLGPDKLCSQAFGPINNLTTLCLEEIMSIPCRLEQVMEWTEADGFSASSWLWLGMAGIAACEVVRRQFRGNSSTDALGEPAEGPALV